MTHKVLIAHARDEEALVEKLAKPLREAGYEAAHEGTVLVGDSVVAETIRVLEQGGPVVLCGTERAVGNRFVRMLANASRRVNQGHLFIVQMEAEADIESLSFGQKIANYWQDPNRAIAELLDAVRRFYPLDEREAELYQAVGEEERYRALLLDFCDIINLANLPEQDRHIAQKQQQLKLRGLYIPLRVHVEFSGSELADLGAAESLLKSLEQRRLSHVHDWLQAKAPIDRLRVSLGERLAQSGRLILLGDPGAGKTTLMRWVVTAYLLRLNKDEHWEELPDVKTLPDADWLPILIRCRDLNAETLAGSLDDILRYTLRRAELNEKETISLAANLRRRLLAGTALLIIDGLDEITEPAARARFCQHLEEIVSAYPKAPVIATSRIVGYREMGYRLGKGFEHLTLADLAPEDQNDFAHRWCLLTEIPERQQSAFEELVHDIHSSERIEKLTANPMLLTTMALVKRKVGKLPNRRAELYGEAVQVLLNWRREVDEPIDSREAVPQLEYLAYTMCERGVQRLRREEILDCFVNLRTEYPNIHPAHNRTPENFLKALETRTGILVEAGHVRERGMLEPVYEFRHLTFQEYLAACALVDNKYPGRDPNRTLAQHVAPLAGYTVELEIPEGQNKEATVVENWREALRLTAGICSDDIADAVLLAIVTPLTDEPASVARARAALGGLCLADEPNVSEETVEQVVAAFAAQVSSDDGGLSGSTSYNSAVRQLMGTRWRQRFQERLIRRFCQVQSDEDMSAGVLGGQLGAISASASEAERAVWLASQGQWLESENDFDAVAASLRICSTILNLYNEKKTCAVERGITDRLVENLFGSEARAVSAVLALAFLALGMRFDAPLPRVWEPDASQTEKIMERLGGPVSNMYLKQGLSYLIVALKDERAVGPLIPWLADPNPDTREAAASALATVGTHEALIALAAHLNDSASYVRQSALGAKAKLTWEDEGYVNPLELNLLTKDFDGSEPFLDPAEPITVDWVKKAAAKIGLSFADVQARYELMADPIGLRLAWREENRQSKEPQGVH